MFSAVLRARKYHSFQITFVRWYIKLTSSYICFIEQMVDLAAVYLHCTTFSNLLFVVSFRVEINESIFFINIARKINRIMKQLYKKCMDKLSINQRQ